MRVQVHCWSGCGDGGRCAWPPAHQPAHPPLRPRYGWKRLCGRKQGRAQVSELLLDCRPGWVSSRADRSRLYGPVVSLIKDYGWLVNTQPPLPQDGPLPAPPSVHPAPLLCPQPCCPPMHLASCAPSVPTPLCPCRAPLPVSTAPSAPVYPPDMHLCVLPSRPARLSAPPTVPASPASPAPLSIFLFSSYAPNLL